MSGMTGGLSREVFARSGSRAATTAQAEANRIMAGCGEDLGEDKNMERGQEL